MPDKRDTTKRDAAATPAADTPDAGAADAGDADIGNLSLGGRADDAGPPPEGPKGIPQSPRQVVCGDIDMRIDRNGTWYYHGSPIGRQALVKLFASVLRRDEAGDYWLITPAEMARLQVEIAPFLAVAMDVDGSNDDRTIRFTTNLGKSVTLSDDRPLRVDIDPETQQPMPFVIVADDGTEALIARAVFYDLVDLGEEIEVDGEPVFGVWSAGDFFPIGRLDGTEARA